MLITKQKYNDLRKDFINTQRKALELLESKPVECFTELEIDCDQLSEEYAENICMALEKAGLQNQSRVLYYLTVEGDVDQLVKTVGKLKKRKRNKIALPKLNDKNAGSGILYVGKTNTKFLNRMLYHLGEKSTGTYALHLKHWAKELDLQVKLYFSLVELPEEEIYLLEMLESVLHHQLKPVLGREGH